MMLSIRNPNTGQVLFSGDYPSFAAMVQAALNLGVNISGADLSNQNLTGVSFANADLSNVNLSGSNVSGADFTDADLADANLANTIATAATFAGAALDGANTTGMITPLTLSTAPSNL